MLRMRVPLADVVQLAIKSLPCTPRETLMERRDSMEIGSPPFVSTLRCCSERNFDMPSSASTQENASRFLIIGKGLAIPADLIQHG